MKLSEKIKASVGATKKYKWLYVLWLASLLSFLSIRLIRYYFWIKVDILNWSALILFSIGMVVVKRFLITKEKKTVLKYIGGICGFSIVLGMISFLPASLIGNGYFFYKSFRGRIHRTCDDTFYFKQNYNRDRLIPLDKDINLYKYFAKSCEDRKLEAGVGFEIHKIEKRNFKTFWVIVYKTVEGLDEYNTHYGIRIPFIVVFRLINDEWRLDTKATMFGIDVALDDMLNKRSE